MMRRGLSMLLSFAMVSGSIGLAFPGRAHAADNESAGAAMRKNEAKVLLAVDQYDENGTIGTAIKYEYNEGGLLTRSAYEYYNKGVASWGFDYLYSYDEDGRLLRRNMYYEEYGTGFDDLVRVYNDKGLLISEETHSDGEVSEEREFSYDEDGRLNWGRETFGSPSLGGKVTNEYSYSYHTDDQGDLVGVRKNVAGSGEEEVAVVYDPDGLLVQGSRNYAEHSVSFRYEYLDIPGIYIRDEYNTYTSISIFGNETSSGATRVVYILDSAGQEVESFYLGAPETVAMTYDEEGYLVEAYDPTEYYGKTELIYGSLNAGPAAPASAPETLPPLAYEDRTEHHEFTTSDGTLVETSDLAYPYFTGGSQVDEILNDSIRAVLDQRRNAELDQESEDALGEMVSQGMAPSIDNVKITVTYNEGGLLSMLYRYTIYSTGAMHPLTGYEGYIYDASTGSRLGVQELAGSRYSQMCSRLAQTASGQGVSRGTPDNAEACVLSEEGVGFYFNVGAAVPVEIVNVPFTTEYFDRAPAGGETSSPEDMSSILTQEEAYARAVAGSEYEDGETQTINGAEFVIQFWDCGRAGYNGRSVYVYQVRRLRKIDGPQTTQLLETVLVDAMTGECTVMSPAEPWALEDDPLSNNSAGGNTPAPENKSPDQEQHPILTVTGDAVNVRSGPDTSYKSLGSVDRGDKLFSTGKSGNWYQVEFNGGKGYIIADYVTIGSGGFYTTVDSGTLSVDGVDVNIRSGPGTEYQSIGKVSRGTTLTITGKSDDWYQVDYNGRTGYIIEDYVIKNG